jgi:Tfp pilus assembly protein PilF
VAAWAQLSQAQELLPWYELAPWQDSLDQAERAARHALAIDGHSAEAHAALANVLRDRFAFGEAAREYQRSLELNPGLSEVHNQYGQLLDAIGMFDAAAAQERIAIAQDPLAPNPQYMLGLLFDTERRHDEASAAFERVIRIAPRYVYAYDQLVFSRIYAGDYAQARVDVAATVGKAGEDRQLAIELIEALARPDRRARALPLAARMHRIGNVEMGDFARAFWCSLLGARPQAIAALGKWADAAPQGQRFNGLRFLWMPAFDPIRNDPGFKAVLRKMGLPYRPDTAETK